MVALCRISIQTHYRVPIHQDLIADTVGVDVSSKYSLIRNLLETDLENVIGGRNKIAHGQWVWELNNKETTFVSEAAAPLNYLSIERRAKIIQHIAEIINALAVSEPTFQRDFDNHYNSIIDLRARLVGHDYPSFAAQLRARNKGPVGPPAVGGPEVTAPPQAEAAAPPPAPPPVEPKR